MICNVAEQSSPVRRGNCSIKEVYAVSASQCAAQATAEPALYRKRWGLRSADIDNREGVNQGGFPMAAIQAGLLISALCLVRSRIDKCREKRRQEAVVGILTCVVMMFSNQLLAQCTDVDGDGYFHED